VLVLPLLLLLLLLVWVTKTMSSMAPIEDLLEETTCYGYDGGTRRWESFIAETRGK
jgi:hypothetical protein